MNWEYDSNKIWYLKVGRWSYVVMGGIITSCFWFDRSQQNRLQYWLAKDLNVLLITENKNPINPTQNNKFKFDSMEEARDCCERHCRERLC